MSKEYLLKSQDFINSTQHMINLKHYLHFAYFYSDEATIMPCKKYIKEHAAEIRATVEKIIQECD